MIQEDLTCGEGGSTGAVVLDRVNEHEHEIGDLDLLSTDVKTDLASAINEVDAEAVVDRANIATNTADIATNTSAIATNTADIATNTANIATNTGDIVLNAAEIAINAADIAELKATLPAKGSMRLQGDLIQVIGNAYETMECFNAVSSERGDIDVTVGSVGSIQYTGLVAVEAEIQYGINADFASNEELEVIPYINGVPYSDDPVFMRGLGTNKPVSFFWISQVTLQPNDIITLMARSSITNDITVNFQRSVLAMKIDG